MTNEQYLAAIVAALDWPGVGEATMPLEDEIGLVRLIRRNAVSYGELQVLFSQVSAQLREKVDEVDALRMQIAQAREALER